MCGKVRVKPPEKGQGAGELSEGRDRACPPEVTGDFEKGIRAAESLACGGEEMHLGEQVMRGHAKAFGGAGSLQG